MKIGWYNVFSCTEFFLNVQASIRKFVHRILQNHLTYTLTVKNATTVTASIGRKCQFLSQEDHAKTIAITVKFCTKCHMKWKCFDTKAG